MNWPRPDICPSAIPSRLVIVAPRADVETRRARLRHSSLLLYYKAFEPTPVVKRRAAESAADEEERA